MMANAGMTPWLKCALWAEALMDAFPCALTEWPFRLAAFKVKRWVEGGYQRLPIGPDYFRWVGYRLPLDGISRAPSKEELRQREREARRALYNSYQNAAYQQLAGMGLLQSAAAQRQLANAHPYTAPGRWYRAHG